MEQDHIAQKESLVAALKEAARVTRQHHVAEMKQVAAKHEHLSKAHADALEKLKGKHIV